MKMCLLCFKLTSFNNFFNQPVVKCPLVVVASPVRLVNSTFNNPCSGWRSFSVCARVLLCVCVCVACVCSRVLASPYFKYGLGPAWAFCVCVCVCYLCSTGCHSWTRAAWARRSWRGRTVPRPAPRCSRCSGTSRSPGRRSRSLHTTMEELI